jgi:hypothetical protein
MQLDTAKTTHLLKYNLVRHIGFQKTVNQDQSGNASIASDFVPNGALNMVRGWEKKKV